MELPDGLVSSYVNVNGVKTHYVHGGTGEPLILIHGAGPGASGWSGWRQTIPVLAKHYHVIALDTLGFGMTDKPTNIVYSDQASVNHLAGFIDALCLDKVLLCGNSRGAYMATKYMLDHPSRVRRMLLVSSGSLAAAMGIERNEKQKGGTRTLSAYDGTKEAMRRWMEVIVNDHSKITDELITERVRIASLPGHDYALKSTKQYRDGLKSNPNEQQLFDVSHRLPTVDLPMLMVWGGKDNFAPPEFVPQLTEKLPNIKFMMLENSGHQAQNDESDRFNQIAMDFFGQT
jgi:pimeloyl-ACP methyl ester carboxylesterase